MKRQIKIIYTIPQWSRQLYFLTKCKPVPTKNFTYDTVYIYLRKEAVHSKNSYNMVMSPKGSNYKTSYVRMTIQIGIYTFILTSRN